jgi:polysaccharide export outer membrane protein
MNGRHTSKFLVLCGLLLQQVLPVAAGQNAGVEVAMQGTGLAVAQKPGAADGERSPELAGDRHPQYRLCRSDVLEISFTFSPDGFVGLKGAAELYAEGRTLPELRAAIREAYVAILHEPEISVTLREFDGPHFFASGEVGRPGKYELRGELSVSQALAMAGGVTDRAKHSQVVLFRRNSGAGLETRILNVKRMLNSRDLEEDLLLQSGDMVFVPQNKISKVRGFLRAPNVGMYWNPGQY